MTPTPDIFRNVHKGIRKALFDACAALGRAGDDEEEGATARAVLRDALRFVAHHGENEDLLLLPALDERAPALADRMRAAHRHIDDALRALAADARSAPAAALYERACAFTALYLAHMGEEEGELEPGIRAALSVKALVDFGRRSVERTAPADQEMMLAWMLPAMTRADVALFLSRLPAALAERLRPLAARPG